MVAAALDDLHGVLALRRQAGVFVEQLRVAQDAVERRAQLVADGRDVAALGLVGRVGLRLGLLQGLVGAAVRVDLFDQQMRLAVRLLLRHQRALVLEHQPPHHHRADHQEGGEHLEQAHAQRELGAVARGVVQQAVLRDHLGLVRVDRREQQAERRHRQAHQQQILAELGIEPAPHGGGQQARRRLAPLGRPARVGLAEIVAAGVERAAQRADGALVGGARGHVVVFVLALANAALDRGGRGQALVGAGGAGRITLHGRRRRCGRDGDHPLRLARQVVAAARGPGNQRRRDESRDHRDGRREGLRPRPEGAQVGGDAQRRRHAHRAHADRVDVVEVGALEFDAARRPPQRLVDHQVGHHGHDPRDGEVGEEPQHLAERLEHAQLHQHQRDQRVEHHPHHAARVAVREAGKEVGPCQRAGVGIGDVDLELRHHHEHRRERHRHADAREGRAVADEVHLRGVDGAIGGHGVADGQIRQQRPAQHLQHARQHPAGSSRHHAGPPAPTPARGGLGHETQVVGLLAHLRDERHAHRHGRAEAHQVEPGRLPLYRVATVRPDLVQHVRVLAQHIDVGQHQQGQPQRLRPHLQAADHRHAVGDQRHHHQRAQQVTPGWRDVEGQLQRVGHDGRFEREEDEGEAGVDQRGDRGADVAEARAAREQVHVHTVARRVDADRQPGGEDDQRRRQDGPERVDESVFDQQRAAHGFQHQERRRAKGGVGHPQRRPLAKRAWRKAQRVVLQRFAGHPGVVVAPHLDHALQGFGWGRRGGVRLRHEVVAVWRSKPNCVGLRLVREPGLGLG